MLTCFYENKWKQIIKYDFIFPNQNMEKKPHKGHKLFK